MKKLMIITVFLCIIVSCVPSRKETELEFISKYQNYSFESFRNKSMSIRGSKGNNPVILYWDNSKDSTSEKGCTVILIDLKTYKLSELRFDSFYEIQNIPIDTLACYKLALQFLRLDIQYIKFDSDNNLYIVKEDNYRGSGPNLVRTNSIKTVRHNHLFEHFYKNWYRRKESAD